jgi:hypothetical protein
MRLASRDKDQMMANLGVNGRHDDIWTFDHCP